MSSSFDLLDYGSQVYAKVDALSSEKQLLFEAGLCEVLYTLVAAVAKDEDPRRLAAYRHGLDVIRRAAQGEAQPESAVAQARDAVDSLIPDDDAPGWGWTTPLWQNAGISVYYTLGVVAGDEEAGFPLSHYVEAADYVAQSTSGLDTPLPGIEREPVVVQARQIVADMVQALENMDLSPDAVAGYYGQLAGDGRYLASIAERLRDEARARGVNI
ncbi:hypothetical protein [Segniliparus rugosus]|uniref:Uncharacterized protein n=1 Tax=Segniliparus rugosus (strain ATCC BAA-974 / DSM 45345 / CCUG 50838 / CIP 108380 / JCM 13579 / CDC 945) TaxID=679197 RepID=E5XKR3_SEGRC|nr:hypothetical protein [Segniliparus rugosus]EFV15056.1 hypothetical protein HMPREF9336_00082 [Segniliparus rugosus ATCC BAA-974]